MKSLESNSQRIKELKEQINDTTITAKDKTAINKEIAALQKGNEDLEKQLEQINDEQYLVQPTNKILEEEMSKGHFKGTLLDFIDSVSITLVGSAMGGTIGSLTGPRFAGVGAGIGVGTAG